MHFALLDNLAQNEPAKASLYANAALKDLEKHTLLLQEEINIEKIRITAHSIKSIALNLGATEFSEIAKAIEALCRNSKPDQQAIADKTSELLAHYEKIKEGLRTYDGV